MLRRKEPLWTPRRLWALKYRGHPGSPRRAQSAHTSPWEQRVSPLQPVALEARGLDVQCWLETEGTVTGSVAASGAGAPADGQEGSRDVHPTRRTGALPMAGMRSDVDSAQGLQTGAQLGCASSTLAVGEATQRTQAHPHPQTSRRLRKQIPVALSHWTCGHFFCSRELTPSSLTFLLRGPRR